MGITGVILVKKQEKEKLIAKIRNKILENENGCWIWQGAKHKQGYGKTSWRSKPDQMVHRLSWIAFRGDIGPLKFVCHKCDVPQCCNPEHLFLGTQKDNVGDAYKKGRWLPGKLPRQNKLKWEQVQEIKYLSQQSMKRKELQKKFQVGQTCIAKILRGDSWKVNWTQEL